MNEDLHFLSSWRSQKRIWHPTETIDNWHNTTQFDWWFCEYPQVAISKYLPLLCKLDAECRHVASGAEMSWQPDNSLSCSQCAALRGRESFLRGPGPEFAQTLHKQSPRHGLRKAQVKISAFFFNLHLCYGGPRARENILLLTMLLN